MTPTELKAARRALGLSAQGFARTFGVASGRTVRGWEAGERNGEPAPVPIPIALLVRLALDLPEVRIRLGIKAETDAPALSSREPAPQPASQP
jgi:transcriptional regulator with XRE-family HTH domain